MKFAQLNCKVVTKSGKTKPWMYGRIKFRILEPKKVHYHYGLEYYGFRYKSWATTQKYYAIVFEPHPEHKSSLVAKKRIKDRRTFERWVRNLPAEEFLFGDQIIGINSQFFAENCVRDKCTQVAKEYKSQFLAALNLHKIRFDG